MAVYGHLPRLEGKGHHLHHVEKALPGGHSIINPAIVVEEYFFFFFFLHGDKGDVMVMSRERGKKGIVLSNPFHYAMLASQIAAHGLLKLFPCTGVSITADSI